MRSIKTILNTAIIVITHPCHVRERERERERETDRQTDRQTDREIETETDRQTDKERKHYLTTGEK